MGHFTRMDGIEMKPFEEVCKEYGCYCPKDWERAGQIANTPLWLRLWFVYKYKEETIEPALKVMRKAYGNCSSGLAEIMADDIDYLIEKFGIEEKNSPRDKIMGMRKVKKSKIEVEVEKP